MKAIFFKKILLFASISIFLFSCEDESENNESIEQEPLSVKQFEIVPLTFESGDLMYDEYDATLGDASLVLSKHDDTTLVMSVPNVEPGTYNLTIDGLGTYQYSFKVERTELTSEPVTVVEGVSEEMISFAIALPEDDPDKAQLINYFNEFSDYINSADADQQQEIALFYEANREIIDAILYGDSGNNTKCFYCVTTVNQYRVAVLAMAGGVLVAKYAPTPEQKLAGALVALVAFKGAKDYALDILDKRMRVLEVVIEDLNSKSSTLNFIDGEEKEFTMQTQNRGLLDSDRSLGFDDLSIFFYAFDKLNSAINTLNAVITFVNDNVFFIDMDLVPNIEIESLSTELYDLQSDTYNNYSFSIDHPNVTINQEFLSGSSILLIMNVDEDFTFDEPIETQLLVSYEDGFNDLEVTYDVVINPVPENTFIDPRDGQEYNIVTIGNQTWFAENLNYTTGITNVTDDYEWGNLDTADQAWCYYENNASNGETYGALYTYEAAINACPDGWHLPTANEYNILKNYIESQSTSDSVGIILKDQSWGGTNDFGFSALGSGMIETYYDGEYFYTEFTDLNETAAYRTSDINPYGDNVPASFYLNSGGEFYIENNLNYIDGGAVRCVKDQN